MYNAYHYKLNNIVKHNIKQYGLAHRAHNPKGKGSNPFIVNY